MRGHRRQRAVLGLVQQHGTARRPVFSNRLIHFVDDHAVQFLRGGQYALQLLDTPLEVVALRLQLDAAHACEPAKAQVKDVLRLHVVKVEDRDQPRLRGVGVIRGADDLDDLVDVDHGQQQALDQVQALKRLPAAEFAATAHHDAAVVDPHLQHLLETHGVGPAIHQRDVVHREIVLQRRVSEQLREHGVRVETGLDLDDQPGAVMAVGQVDGTGDSLQLAVLHPFGNAFQHPFGADHERQVLYASRMPFRPMMMPPPGQSGPGT